MNEKQKERALSNKGVLDFEQDVQIDPDALDVEWLEQPHLTMKYNVALSEARAEADRAKEQLGVVKAEIDRDIRENPVEYTGENKKPTESAIEQLVIESGRVREAEAEYIYRKEVVGLLKGIVDAIDSKKTALENLVKLTSMSYCAAPSTPRDLSGEYSARQEAKASMRRKKKESMQQARERRTRKNG